MTGTATNTTSTRPVIFTFNANFTASLRPLLAQDLADESLTSAEDGPELVLDMYILLGQLLDEPLLAVAAAPDGHHLVPGGVLVCC